MSETKVAKKKKPSTQKDMAKAALESPQIAAKESTSAQQEDRSLKKLALAFVTHKYYVSTMLFATFIALFGMDLWELCGPPPIESDVFAYAVMFVTFLLFAVELSLLSWGKADYRFSFFWGLDLLACLSLIPDALMLFDFNVISMLGDSTSALTITRAGRAARAGTRAVRIIEVIRKQLKAREMRKRGIEHQPEDDDAGLAIGGKLGDGITEKVIVTVILMLIASQVFSILEQGAAEAAFEMELETLQHLYVACRAGLTPRPATSLARAPAHTQQGMRVQPKSATHGCVPARSQCPIGMSAPSSDPTCHFNLYLRQLVATHDLPPPHCSQLSPRQALECAMGQFRVWGLGFRFSVWCFMGQFHKLCATT